MLSAASKECQKTQPSSDCVTEYRVINNDTSPLEKRLFITITSVGHQNTDEPRYSNEVAQNLCLLQDNFHYHNYSLLSLWKGLSLLNRIPWWHIDCTCCERPFRNVKRSNHDSHNSSYFEEPEPLKEDISWKYWSCFPHNSPILHDLQVDTRLCTAS